MVRYLQECLTVSNRNKRDILDLDEERIVTYQRAVRRMREGDFKIDFSIKQKDAMGILGEELQKLSEHLEYHFDHARKMQEVTDSVSGGLLLDDVLERIFDSFRAVIPYNRLGCALINNDKSTVSICWSRADYQAINLPNGFTAKLAESSLRNIVHTGQPRILNDLAEYLSQNPNSHSTRLIVSEGIRSSLTCPLVSMGKPVGFIFFSSLEPNTYKDVHQGIFRQIATQLSLLIEKSRLYQEIVDINQRLATKQQELQDLAMRDQLTRLYNRRGILELIDGAVAKAKRERSRLALVMIDIDYFKRINDSGGHKAGDEVLREVAFRITSSVREYNHVGRLGGEEFLVLLAQTDCDHACDIAERIRAAINMMPINGHNTSFSVTVSAGVAQAFDPSHSITAEKLLLIADEALYESKRSGRNKVTCRQTMD
jgi:diguanylate cyclase (GGDEF)-like protein